MKHGLCLPFKQRCSGERSAHYAPCEGAIGKALQSRDPAGDCPGCMGQGLMSRLLRSAHIQLGCRFQPLWEKAESSTGNKIIAAWKTPTPSRAQHCCLQPQGAPPPTQLACSQGAGLSRGKALGAGMRGHKCPAALLVCPSKNWKSLLHCQSLARVCVCSDPYHTPPVRGNGSTEQGREINSKPPMQGSRQGSCRQG